MNTASGPHSILVRHHRPDEEILDEVYERFAHSDPFLPITHFIDHVTMGSEALVGLGLGPRARPWSARHHVRPYSLPITGIPIASTWRQALGRRECHGDWLRLFETELEADPFPTVIARWVPRFAHDVGAFLFHGLIRTAHATRALAHRNTPARRGELARGLALWAIGIKASPPEDSPGGAPLDDPWLDSVHFARIGAATFITAPNVPNLHLVTGPMAYGLVAPHLDAATHRLAAQGFARTHARASESFQALKEKANAAPIPSLTDRHLDALAAQRDAHPIKLTEAALRAHEQTADEIFLKAAGKALDTHGPRALLRAARNAITRRPGLRTPAAGRT